MKKDVVSSLIKLGSLKIIGEIGYIFHENCIQSAPDLANGVD